MFWEVGEIAKKRLAGMSWAEYSQPDIYECERCGHKTERAGKCPQCGGTLKLLDKRG